MRYQYLEDLVTDREKANIALREELDKVLLLFHSCQLYKRLDFIFYFNFLILPYSI